MPDIAELVRLTRKLANDPAECGSSSSRTLFDVADALESLVAERDRLMAMVTRIGEQIELDHHLRPIIAEAAKEAK